MAEYRNVAHLVGFNSEGQIVYEVVLPIGEYYDGEHCWDTTDGVLNLGLTLLTGRLYENDGHVFQEFETAFSKATGKYIGSKATHDDGSVQLDGIYDAEG